MQLRRIVSCALAGWLASIAVTEAAEWGLKKGNPAIKSANALAFGPDGILFVGDSKGAAIFAIDTGDNEIAKTEPSVAGLNGQIATLLGTTPDKITVNDLAVNPRSGKVYVAVTKGAGTEATPAIIRIAQKLTVVSLTDIPFQQAALADAPKTRK